MKHVLLGASGTAKVIISSLLNRGLGVADILILDDDVSKIGTNLLGVDVVDVPENLCHSLNIRKYAGKVINCIGSIGDNTNRNNMFGRFRECIPKGFNGFIDFTSKMNYTTHPESVIVLPRVVINAGAVIGHNVLINTGTIIEHDCKIGDYTFISPGCNIAGNVTIGKNVFVGIGTTIIGGVTIGDNAVIGAGSLVLRDVESNSKVYGHPTHK